MVPVALISVKLPVVALTVAACTVPVTLKFVRPARFVMFAVVKLPVVALTVAACTVPVTLKFVRPVRFVMFAFVAVSVPLTVALLIFAVVILAVVAVKLVRFARLVILFKVP